MKADFVHKAAAVASLIALSFFGMSSAIAANSAASVSRVRAAS